MKVNSSQLKLWSQCYSPRQLGELSSDLQQTRLNLLLDFGQLLKIRQFLNQNCLLLSSSQYFHSVVMLLSVLLLIAKCWLVASMSMFVLLHFLLAILICKHLLTITNFEDFFITYPSIMTLSLFSHFQANFADFIQILYSHNCSIGTLLTLLT